MTYRDDTALQEACDALADDVTSLQQRLVELEGRKDELDIYIRHARRGLVVRSIRKWYHAHRRGVLGLALLLGLAAGVGVTLQITSRALPPAPAPVARECKTRLLVSASHPGAVASLNGRSLGAVPVNTLVCPGLHRLHLVHPKTLPWQVPLRVGKQKKIEYNTQLISRSGPRPPGTLVFSRPPGALVFVDGEEVGWAPVFVRRVSTNKALLRLGLWRPDRPPGVWRVPPRPSIWLYLGPLRPEAAP